MRRRDFIVLGAAAGAWPLLAHAQQATRVPVIGFFGASTASIANQRVSALLRRLRELGWVEGRTVAIEYRWAEGSSENLDEVANELVRLKVDVIFANSTAAVHAIAADRAAGCA